MTTKLSFYIEDKALLARTIIALNNCATPKEWVKRAIYPLYLEEAVTYEDIHTRRFIAATVPFCKSLKTPTIGNLHHALYKYFNLKK